MVMVQQITTRYRDRLSGILSCYDRIVITGTLPDACYAAGMTAFLYMHQIRIFDYARFAEPLRDRIREKAQFLADESGVTIEFVAKTHIRKEDLVAAVLKERGDHPGLVHILSAMEACDSYEPWHNKANHKTYLKQKLGKCLHYYFYFMDEELGLVYLRVPTWCPFRLQFYCNGHSWLAKTLTSRGIGYAMADNAFINIEDWGAAQKLADSFSPDQLHRILDRYAAMCCPVLDVFPVGYHWSLMQIEYSTDLVFHSTQIMKPLYEELSRQAILSVKAEQVATFLGKKITPQLAQEIGSRFATRIEGTCIKHSLGKATVKMYDKFGRVLRLETMTNDVSFFKHHRKVEHRDGSSEYCLATIKKSIYSLVDLREVLLGCNKRYLEYLSALDDFSAGHRNLEKLIGPKEIDGQKLKGLNFFDKAEQILLCSLQRPQFNIKGMRRSDIKPFLPNMSAAGISRQLWRLKKLGIIKKVVGTYRYYLTRLGRSAIAACCRLTETTIVPALA
jgi:hypothetical protein